MAHASDDAHGHGHGHGAHPAPAPVPAGPPPPHVLAIARGTRWVGLALWALGFLAALLEAVRARHGAAAWLLFLSLYGLSVWLAARDTLARGAAAPGPQ